MGKNVPIQAKQEMESAGLQKDFISYWTWKVVYMQYNMIKQRHKITVSCGHNIILTMTFHNSNIFFKQKH